MSVSTHVSPVSRRILVYWLLLLVPTLVVAFFAVQLLRREQLALAQQQALIGEARHAAAAGRAGLIVESIELLVDDVQTNLLDTLAEMPAATLDSELDAWERASPLVRTAFRCDRSGEIVRPSSSSGEEEGRGFRRRFAALFRSNPPWGMQAKKEADGARQEVQFDAPYESKLRAAASKDERAAREQASANVAQVQMARRDAQLTSKVSNRVAEAAAAPAPAAYGSGVANLGLADRAEAVEERNLAPARRGWTPWTADGRLHLLGWIESGGEIRGVEAEVSALISRLGAALPAEPAKGEGYALRDGRGRVMHQTGWIPRDTDEPAIRLPVAAGTLPGWEVVAFLDAPAAASSDTAGFLFLGSVLVAILLVAILAGGSLLFRQARRSEAEAAQKTSFVANVSHEFKTPLTTIRLYSELLEQGRVPNEERRSEYLRTIGRETQRLSRLVGNALDFSRLEQGRKKYARERIELREEIGRLLDTHAPRYAEAGLRVDRDLGPDLIAIETDRDALEQILLNLLDNAAKYASAGGEIRVELARRPAGGATVRVLDRGPGVPAAHAEQIFEKFHRVDDTLTAEKTGAGLGLSIARQLARGLGGDLRYASRDGGGAQFILELPA